MLTSLGLVFLVGLALASICQKIKLPRIIGMIATGVILGPFVLDFLAPELLNISAELRQMALVIILLKAGLSLNIADLKQAQRPAILLAFLPASFELIAYVIFAPLLLNLSITDALLMGAVLAAVSPAVVVPKMVALIEQKRGTKKTIPQMILASASLDDVYVIVLFTTFLTMATGGEISAFSFLNIPLAIVFGSLGGALTGFVIGKYFVFRHDKNKSVRGSVKAVTLLGVAFLLLATETVLEHILPFSAMLGIICMAVTIKIVTAKTVAVQLSAYFGKLWIAAEIVLFVLVGAAVDIRYTLSAGLPAIALILLALLIRSTGTYLALLGTKLNIKERLFCVIAYLPKATVQAAIGALPLSMGLPSGNIILSVAVLGILITAPLGAFGMEVTCEKFLTQD